MSSIRFASSASSTSHKPLAPRRTLIASWRSMLSLVVLPVCILVSTNIAHASTMQLYDHLTLYTAPGCAHCAAVETYLNDYGRDLTTRSTARHAREFVDAVARCGDDTRTAGVPMLSIAPLTPPIQPPVVDDHTNSDTYRCLYGDTAIITYLRDGTLPPPSDSPHTTDKPVAGCSDDAASTCAVAPPTPGRTMIGSLISAALVDAINPCAFAVLILLLASIIKRDNKRRVILSGLGFAGAIFVSYLAMGLGLYTALATSSTTQRLTLAIGLFACALGLRNIKDAIRYNAGPNIEVPHARRPLMKKIIKRASHPLGAVAVGFVISLFLLPCTSGPYIVILGMLQSQTSFMTALPLIIIYNLVFVSPMIAITLAIHFGANIHVLEERRRNHIRLLHLIGGLILIGLSLIVLRGPIMGRLH